MDSETSLDYQGTGVIQAIPPEVSQFEQAVRARWTGPRIGLLDMNQKHSSKKDGGVSLFSKGLFWFPVLALKKRRKKATRRVDLFLYLKQVMFM